MKDINHIIKIIFYYFCIMSKELLPTRIQQIINKTLPMKVNHKSNFNMANLMQANVKNHSSTSPNTKLIYSSTFKISQNSSECFSKIQLIPQQTRNKKNIFQVLCEETFEKISLGKNKGQDILRQSRRKTTLYAPFTEQIERQKQIDFLDNNPQLQNYRSQFLNRWDQQNPKILNRYMFKFNLPQDSKRKSQIKIIKRKNTKKLQVDSDNQNDKSSRYQIKTIKKSQQKIQRDTDFIKPPIQHIRILQSKACLFSSRIKSAIKLSNPPPKQQISNSKKKQSSQPKKKQSSQPKKNSFLIQVSTKQFSLRPKQKIQKVSKINPSTSNKIKPNQILKTENKPDLQICPWLMDSGDLQY